jgi:ABC-type branched-subunit amino acid transport system ATPase component
MLMQFGGLKALNKVDLTWRGTIHGLIGPNGSGKSTMMNVLTGIYKPTGAPVRFDGVAMVGPHAVRDRAGRHRAHLPERAAVRRDDLLENVLVGLHHTFRSNLFGRDAAHAALPPRGAAARERRASILNSSA